MSRLAFLIRILLPAFLLLAGNAHGYDDRVALVIGNDAYPTEPLKNAVNDARAVARTLTDLGFKVVVKTNADIATMRGAAVEFAKILDGATAAVFYYAGHGIQYRDKNYLVPVDAKLNSEPEIVYNALEVGQLLESMDDAKVRYKFIVLDACRNNPFSNVFASTGLAKIAKVPPGTIISYAAAAGAVALDGEGENGLYTTHLLKEIREPGVPPGQVFQRVASGVAQDSANKQLPELYSTPLPRANFFFAERGAQAAITSGVSGDAQAALEREFWSSVKDSKQIADFQAYLAQFPSGTFAPLARSRIDTLKQAQAQVAAAPLSATPVNQAPLLVAEPARPAAAQVTAPAEIAKPAVEAVKTAVVPTATSTAAAPAPAPVVVAKAATTTDTRSLGAESKPETKAIPQAKPSAAPVFVPPASTAAVTEAKSVPEPAVRPAPELVASISPEQKTALIPPPPPVPKILSGLIEFPDGARYNGEYLEDKEKTKILNGPGEFISKNFRYKGDFKDGKKQGRGVYEWSNGDKFDGTFVDDKPSGSGKWDFASGDKYAGEVVNGVIVGKGVFIARNGDRFEGPFVDGKPNGKGVYRFATGDRFEGDMLAGKMSGRGVYINKDGDRLEANFNEGVPQGKGIYYFSNGDRYEGDIAGGALTGKGAYYYSNGLRSEGEFVNGTLKGKGAFYFNDGSWFEGTFEDGLKRAKGTSYLKDGSKYEAEIIDGAVKLHEKKP
ncbi:MAG: caspase family protein [Betaproteobacteria bacterium]|nr:caspase family protein [Betaproteobacteria bacterium]